MKVSKPAFSGDGGLSATRTQSCVSVLIVVPTYFPESYGGAEQQCRKQASALQALGLRTHILTPACDADAVDGIEAGTPISRIRVRHYPNLGGRFMGSFAAWTLAARRWMLARRDSFDVVYIFHARLHALGPAMAARRLGKPCFIKLGGGGRAFELRNLRQKKYFYGRFAEWQIRRATTAFIANSPQIAHDLRGIGVEQRKIIEIPNGTQVPARTAIEALLKQRNGRRFIFAGRLTEVKNLPLIIEAAEILEHREVPVQIELVGDGPLMGLVKAEVEKRRLAHRITLRGAMSDIAPALAAADFYLSSSLIEGQSNSLIEAMAQGLIPVTVVASGVEKLVEPGKTGFLVEHPSALDLANAMQTVTNLSEERRSEISLAAHDRIAGAFTIEAVARATADHFRAAARRSP